MDGALTPFSFESVTQILIVHETLSQILGSCARLKSSKKNFLNDNCVQYLGHHVHFINVYVY